MGIKDWFGGDRKKAEFREKAKETLAKGRLTPEKLAELESLRKAHAVEDPGDDKTMLRREIYNEAAGAVRARGKLSEAETAELEKIQKFLALRDDQIDKTKRDLVRLRTINEIRQGRLPVVPASNAALRSIPFEEGEIAHYTLPVEALDRTTVSGFDGVAVKWGNAYQMSSAKGHKFPEEGVRPMGEGTLILTNQRLIFRGQKNSAAVKYTPDANFFLYADGLRLQRQVGNTLLKFRTKSKDTSEIVGELLSALMR